MAEAVIASLIGSGVTLGGTALLQNRAEEGASAQRKQSEEMFRQQQDLESRALAAQEDASRRSFDMAERNNQYRQGLLTKASAATEETINEAERKKLEDEIYKEAYDKLSPGLAARGLLSSGPGGKLEIDLRIAARKASEDVFQARNAFRAQSFTNAAAAAPQPSGLLQPTSPYGRSGAGLLTGSGTSGSFSPLYAQAFKELGTGLSDAYKNSRTPRVTQNW